MSKEIKFEPRSIAIKQNGFLDWHWEVRDARGFYVSSGFTLTQKRALRRARRYRKAFLSA